MANLRTAAYERPHVGVLPLGWGARFIDPSLLLGCIVLTAIAQPHLFAADTLVSLDTATQYYPWYAFLGQSLRAGHIPVWNPSTFSGTPFAANPLSGWGYLPAMFIFAVLPIASAIRVYLLFHPFLAALGAFGLARVLGLSRIAALLAGVAYANSGFFDVQNVRSNPFASVYAWLPVALIGTELALRQTHWHARIAWWGLAAVSISQSIGVWPGQGAYYSAMLVAGYIAYRTLLVPATPSTSVIARTAKLVVHGAAIFVAAAALAAAGLLPRLEFGSVSNLAAGYAGAEASVGGLNPREWLLTVVPGYWYVGISVFCLAVIAAFVAPARLRPSVGFFGLTSLGAVLISGRYDTPLHWLLYHLLPGFGTLHPHAPERIMTVAYLGPALLAGAGLVALQERGWTLRNMRLGPRAASIAPGLLVLLVVADLAVGGAKGRADVMLTDIKNGADKLIPVDLATYFEPDAPARFLQTRIVSDGTPSRYIGYAPYLSDGTAWPYTTRFMDPSIAALQVDNRALTLGLQDAQGYDALHIERYDTYFAALNGRSQNYHDAEVFWGGLRSPLLDLLNVRYLVVPTASRLDVSDTAALARYPQTVYSDSNVRILENPYAFPRAWIVHSAIQTTAMQALAEIDSGEVAARSIAVLEVDKTPPALSEGVGSERADVALDWPDRIVVHTSTTATGMLVLSEVYYPAWHAYVDNQPVQVFLADGALRAVAVPPGDHVVEFRFESLALTVGCAISAASALLVLTLWIVGRFVGRRRLA